MIRPISRNVTGPSGSGTGLYFEDPPRPSHAEDPLAVPADQAQRPEQALVVGVLEEHDVDAGEAQPVEPPDEPRDQAALGAAATQEGGSGPGDHRDPERDTGEARGQRSVDDRLDRVHEYGVRAEPADARARAMAVIASRTGFIPLSAERHRLVPDAHLLERRRDHRIVLRGHRQDLVASSTIERSMSPRNPMRDAAKPPTTAIFKPPSRRAPDGRARPRT